MHRSRSRLLATSILLHQIQRPKERSVYNSLSAFVAQGQDSSFGSIGSAGIDSRSQYLLSTKQGTSYSMLYTPSLDQVEPPKPMSTALRNSPQCLFLSCRERKERTARQSFGRGFTSEDTECSPRCRLAAPLTFIHVLIVRLCTS